MRPKPIVRLDRSERAKRKFSEDVKQQVPNYLEFKERLESLKFIGRISSQEPEKAGYSAPIYLQQHSWNQQQQWLQYHLQRRQPMITSTVGLTGHQLNFFYKQCHSLGLGTAKYNCIERWSPRQNTTCPWLHHRMKPVSKRERH